MPTYDYTCQACSHTWDEFQPMSATPTKTCPACGKRKARRLIGAGAGLIFKGSGFYCTDYRKTGAKSSSETSSSPSSGNSSDGGGSASATPKAPTAATQKA